MGKGHVGDFLSFWIDDTHSSDLGLTRVSDGSRYTKTLLPSFKDQTADVPGGDGTYYYGSRYEKKEIPVKVAFDDLSEVQLRQITQLLGDQQMHRLVFDEEPYKEYVVKLSKAPEFKFLCFEENGQRVYKGEGELSFVCYDGYARARTGYKWLEDYDLEVFSNRDEWLEASKISSKTFGWKILVGNENAGYQEGVEVPFILNEQVSPVMFGVTLNLLQIYQIVIRDGDLKGNILDDENYIKVKPVYHKIIGKPSLLYIPNIGERLGISIGEDEQHGQIIFFNEGNSIQAWVEDRYALPWVDCYISIYRLLDSFNKTNSFDEFIGFSSNNLNKSANYYVNNFGDVETPFKILIYSNYLPHMVISLNGEKILELDEVSSKVPRLERGFQINTKSHLIEGFDYNNELNGSIYNDKIISGTFKNLPLGENVLTLETDNIQEGVRFDLSACFLEYTPYYL